MRVELTNATRRYLIPASRIGSMPVSPFMLLPAIPSRGWLLKYILFNHNGDDGIVHINDSYFRVRHDGSSEDLVDAMTIQEVLGTDASTHVAVPLPYEVQSNTAIELSTSVTVSGPTEPLEVIIVADKLML